MTNGNHCRQPVGPQARHQIRGDVSKLEEAGANYGWTSQQEGVLGGRHPLIAEREATGDGRT